LTLNTIQLFFNSLSIPTAGKRKNPTHLLARRLAQALASPDTYTIDDSSEISVTLQSENDRVQLQVYDPATGGRDDLHQETVDRLLVFSTFEQPQSVREQDCQNILKVWKKQDSKGERAAKSHKCDETVPKNNSRKKPKKHGLTKIAPAKTSGFLKFAAFDIDAKE
jgi:hypothetical protein